MMGGHTPGLVLNHASGQGEKYCCWAAHGQFCTFSPCRPRVTGQIKCPLFFPGKGDKWREANISNTPQLPKAILLQIVFEPDDVCHACVDRDFVMCLYNAGRSGVHM